MAGERDLRAHLGGHLRDNGMLVALVAIVVFFSVILQMQPQPINFLTPQNITNIFLQNGHVIILALGMLLVIVSGHIDLSVGSVAAFTGAVDAAAYARLIALHEGLTEAESHALNARLVLILMNHVGDEAVLAEAMSLARSAARVKG